MREIEKAMMKARSLIQGRPKPVPIIEGASSVQPNADHLASHGLSGMEQSAPNKPAARREQPVLEADFAGFRENFGSASDKARNIDGAFRVLRTHVLDAMKARGVKVLGITSPAPSAGKTVTSIHLAMACARRAEQEVFLADFDYRRPAIAQYLNATGFQSSIGYFQGEGNIEDYLTCTEQGNLHFLLTDRATEMSAEYLASSKMDKALQQLSRNQNTIIVADLPPLIGCDDTLAMLPKLDGVLLVIPSGEYNYSSIERIASLIPEEKLVATVLNKVPAKELQYEYSY